MVTPERLVEVPNAAENGLTCTHKAINSGGAFEIRDLGSHSAATVTTLALLLAGTVDVRRDPKRKNFYEVVDGSQVYYIHVSPVTGIIYLLAVWENTAAQSNAARGQCPEIRAPNTPFDPGTDEKCRAEPTWNVKVSFGESVSAFVFGERIPERKLQG